MFCPTCGIALAQQMKYCNRCGSQSTTRDAEVIQIIEKRMDSEMEGLFWITAFSLGFVLGGIAVMKKLNLSEGLLIAYMILCAIGFLSYFGLGVWQIRRLSRSLRHTAYTDTLPPADTNELNPANARASLAPVLSVTEHTTRTLEPISKR